jgi:hypothetical protein
MARRTKAEIRRVEALDRQIAMLDESIGAAKSHNQLDKITRTRKKLVKDRTALETKILARTETAAIEKEQKELEQAKRRFPPLDFNADVRWLDRL